MNSKKGIARKIPKTDDRATIKQSQRETSIDSVDSMFEHPTRPELVEPFTPSRHGYKPSSQPRKESQQIERQPALPTRSTRTSTGESDEQQRRRQSAENCIIETGQTPETPRRMSVLKRPRASDGIRGSPSKKPTKEIETASKDIIATKLDNDSQQAVAIHRRRRSDVHTTFHPKVDISKHADKDKSFKDRIDSPRLPDGTVDVDIGRCHPSISVADHNIILECITPDVRAMLRKATPDDAFVPDQPLVLVLSNMDATIAEMTRLNSLERLLHFQSSFSNSTYLKTLSAYKTFLETAREYSPNDTKYPLQIQHDINELFCNLMESDPRSLHKLNEQCDEHARYATESRRVHFRRMSYHAGLAGAEAGSGAKGLEEEEKKKLRIATVTEKCMLALGRMALHCASHIEQRRDSRQEM